MSWPQFAVIARSLKPDSGPFLLAHNESEYYPTPANAGVGVDTDSLISGSFQFPPVRHIQKDSVAGLVDTERLSFLVNMRDHHFRHFAGIG